MKSTLCWHCARAVAKCPWSKHFKPVKGWTAIPTVIKSLYLDGTILSIDSYVVLKCPLFIPDAECKPKPTNADVAKKLRISQRTYYRWVSKHIIDCHGNFINEKEKHL